MSDSDDTTGINRNERKRAVLRLVLGQLQIIGATAGLILLLRTGVSSETVVVVGTTLAVSIASRAIFRVRPGGKARRH